MVRDQSTICRNRYEIAQDAGSCDVVEGDMAKEQQWSAESSWGLTVASVAASMLFLMDCSLESSSSCYVEGWLLLMNGRVIRRCLAKNSLLVGSDCQMVNRMIFSECYNWAVQYLMLLQLVVER